MILVTGGTGTLGRETVARLSGEGREVRVLTRDATHDAGPHVEVVTGDLRDPATVTAAAKGATAVVSGAHGLLGRRGAGPEQVDRRGNADLVRAAVEAGVEHFVLMSVLNARHDHPMSLHRAKHAAERSLHASPLSWTILRPSSYVETWTGIVGARVASGGPAIVFGRAVNPINFVSVLDVATLVVRALTDPELRGQTIDVTGPVNLTLEQLAQHLGASSIRHVPRSALRFSARILAPLAPAFARQAGAALVMDTADMTADASALTARFPDIDWQSVVEIAHQYCATRDRAPQR